MNNKLFAISVISILIVCNISNLSAAPLNDNTILIEGSNQFTITTTQDFMNGTMNGTAINNNNLYSYLNETFDTSPLTPMLTEYGNWALSSGYISDYSNSQYGLSHLVNTYSFNLSEITELKTVSKTTHVWEYVMSYMALSGKETIPTAISFDPYTTETYLSTHTDILVNSYPEGTSNEYDRLRISYHNGSARLYWNGATSTWSSSVSNAVDITSIWNEYFQVKLVSNGEEIYINVISPDSTPGINITTDSIPITSIRNYAENFWMWSGKPHYNYVNHAVRDYQIYSQNTSWVSSVLEPPVNKKLRQLEFIIENGTENSYINKIEILDSSDNSIIDTSNKSLTETGIYSKEDFDYEMNGTLNTDYKIKVYFTNNEIDNLLTINSISGGYSEVEISEVSMSPELDITYFGNYYIYTNITSLDNVDTVLANISGINGEELSYWNYYVNGTPYFNNISKEMDYISGDMYRTIIRPDNIYPEIFFAPNEIIWYNEPLNMNLYRQNYQLFHYNNSFDLVNGTNLWVEFNAVPNSVTAPFSTDLQVYIAEQGHNNSYFNSDWRSSNETELIATINRNDAFDHQHSPNSSHHTVMITVNENGTVGNKNLNITNDFWVILYSSSNTISRGWSLRYHPQAVATNTNNWYRGNLLGLTTTYQSGVPDAHIHLARNIEPINDGVNITIWANDTEGNSDNYTIEYFFGELPNLAPNPTIFTNPVNGTYSGIINVSWLPANDPNGDNLTYNLTLLNDDGSYNQTLINSTENTYFLFDTLSVDNGAYDLMVIITDGEFFVNFTHSGTFDSFIIFNDIENPFADAGTDSEIYVFNTFIFDGSESSDNVEITNYTWSFVYNGTETMLYGIQPEFEFNIPGIYSVTLIVYDNVSNNNSDGMILTVINIPPIADAGNDILTYIGNDNTFDASDTIFGNSTNLNYTWSFVYNNTEIVLYGLEQNFTFYETGNYEITLTVTDEFGYSDTDTMIVSVKVSLLFIILMYLFQFLLGLLAIILILKLLKKVFGYNKRR